ncbi:alpha/beta hydrolase [Nesterenkonia alba]|uniref:alpha/beta hydrolase n=1 Tax=Nesterenkonia alba TaxID=515814 RepID=UPI000A04A138|nr:alpha/beta hydrolase [Nesterenkonia alba]
MPEPSSSAAANSPTEDTGTVSEQSRSAGVVLTEDLLSDSPPGTWVPDYLPGCERMTLPLGTDEEGPFCATLVRLRQQPPATDRPHSTGQPHSTEQARSEAAPVLQIHGWTDYFYNLPTARRWAAAGHPFYALDLRKYGRSLRAHHTPGHIENLADYDAEISAALDVIATQHPDAPPPILCGHSTGGLVAALWAADHQQAVTALVLNSPWLELPGDVPARAAAEGLISPLSRINPLATVKVPRLENYWESLSDEAHGEWQLHPQWRPRKMFPMTLGWLRAVFAGHRRVHGGLGLDLPVLVLLSTGTVYRPQWTPEYQENDGVLDVDLLARRAVRLGHRVTVVRVPGAMHDVFATREPVRSEAFAEVARWMRAYGE